MVKGGLGSQHKTRIMIIISKFQVKLMDLYKKTILRAKDTEIIPKKLPELFEKCLPQYKARRVVEIGKNSAQYEFDIFRALWTPW